MDEPLKAVSNVIELKPGHQYLLVFKGDITIAQLEHVMKMMRAHGIQGVGVGLDTDITLEVIEEAHDYLEVTVPEIEAPHD